MINLVIVFLLIISAATQAYAEFYEYQDANGNIIMTDNPGNLTESQRSKMKTIRQPQAEQVSPPPSENKRSHQDEKVNKQNYSPGAGADKLFPDLHSSNPAVREHAARELGKTRNFDGIREALKDPEPKVRRAAISQLSLESPSSGYERIDQKAMAIIIQCLKDSDAGVKSDALNRLRDNETSREFQAVLAPAMCASLSELLNDPDKHVKQLAEIIHKGCKPQESPKTAGVIYKRGMQHIYSKQFEQGIALISDAADKFEQKYATSPADFRSSENLLPRARTILADYYRWRLKDYRKAAAEYRKLISVLEKVGQDGSMVSAYYLMLGEIYEKDVRDYTSALSCYESALRALNSPTGANKNPSDTYLKWVKESVRFTIERMNIKLNRQKEFSSRIIRYPNLDFRYFVFAASAPGLTPPPAVMFEDEDFAPLSNSDLPPVTVYENLVSKYTCIQQAFSMGTYLFYSYIEKKRMDDADAVLKSMIKYCPRDLNIMMFHFELTDVYRSINKIKYDDLKKRGSDIAAQLNVSITGSEARFSSPEKTWQHFISALKNKDVKTAVECFSPETKQSYEENLNQLREKLPEMAVDLATIHRYPSGTLQEGVAKYSLLRKQDGKEYSFEVTFGNYAGDWKIVSF